MQCSLEGSTESKGFVSVIHSKSTLEIDVVRDRLNNRISEVMQSLVADSQKRQGFRDNIGLLSRGIFYQQDYLPALKEKKQGDRLEYFRKRDALYNGYLNPKLFMKISISRMLNLSPKNMNKKTLKMFILMRWYHEKEVNYCLIMSIILHTII